MASIHPFLRARRWLLGLGVLLAALHLSLIAAEVPDAHALVVPALPEWIEAPLPLPPAPALAANSPVRWMLVEEQVDIERKATFRHYAMRVESEAGLQSAGQVTLSFSKDYETLQWHFLRVWRDGVMRERLVPDVLQVLRQEEDADRFMYHGRLSVLAVLRDVRVGDVIEYAYTRTGANPVFAGKFSTRFAGAFGAPVDRLSYRILAARNRPLHVAPLGDFKPQHRTTDLAGRVEHRWNAENLAALRPLGDAPGWEIQYPLVQLSEFASWQEIADWGCELFTAPPALSAELLERASALTEGLPSEAAKANALLRFVQDELRYLAIHFGESTHRPYLPDEVFQRRFGDCKDKSLLLVVLLRYVGLNAHVALVHSEWRRALADLQPSPLSFDHAIVHVELPNRLLPPSAQVLGGRKSLGLIEASKPLSAGASAPLFGVGSAPQEAVPAHPSAATKGNLPYFETTDRDLWLDATSTLQGGPLTERQHGNFGFALVLAPETVALRRVAPAAVPGYSVRVREKYSAVRFDAPARLEVTTTYRGGYADVYRYHRRQSDPAQAAQMLTGILGRYFPEVKSLGPIEWSDDRETNTLTARSSFDVPKFWSVEANGKLRVAEVYPWGISERLPRPDSMERAVAFSLDYPVKVTHEIELILPKEWPDASDRATVEDETFRFRSESETKGNRLHLTYEWATLAEAVPAARMGEWSKKMAEVRVQLGYKVTQNIRLAEEMKRQGVVWPLTIVIAVGLLGGTALGVWLYHRTGRPRNEPPPLVPANLVGIAGWLYLPAFACVLRPFVLLKALWPTVVLAVDRPSWIAATDGESVGYISGYYLAALAEAMLGVLFIAWSVVLAVQFFRRKQSLPFTFVAYSVGFVSWAIIHVAWLRYVPLPNPAALSADLFELVKLLVNLAVWIPYFLLSRRVQGTFTR